VTTNNTILNISNNRKTNRINQKVDEEEK